MAKKKNLTAEELPQIELGNGDILKAIGDVTKDAYIDFGRYINTHRHLANLDGLKISYRRLIYAAMQFPKNKIVHAGPLIASVQNYHPHGIMSMNEMAANLVNSGVFMGEGNFGYIGIDGSEIPPANERYTSIGLSDLYWELMGDLIKEVPYSESPVGPLEPDYLPLPLPLCLRGDTKVRLTDGRNLTLKELTEEFKAGKENYVLSCNLDGDFQVSKIINSCKTKTTGNYLRITLDNGEIINSTMDHLFMMRDGSYKRADELQEKDSLMPGYISESNDGRKLIKNNFSLNTSFIYKLSDLYNIHHGVYTEEKENIHHVDKNKFNDNPNNLIRLSNREHGLIHKEDFIKNTQSEESKLKRNKTLKLYWENEENHILAKNRWKETGDIPNSKGKTRRDILRENRIIYNKSDIAKENVKNWWNSSNKGKNKKELLKNILTERNKSEYMKQKVKDYWNSDKGLERKLKISSANLGTKASPDNIKKATRNRFLSDFKKYIKSGISKEEALNKIFLRPNFLKWFENKEDFIESEKTYNHSIVSIEIINDKEEDFYDITVDSKYHNFLLSAGVVVHNCIYMKEISSGLGVGISMMYPNFSAWSMYQAYINNDPQLLEPSVDLILDKNNSELEKLWKTGKGRVVYVYKISRQKSSDGKTEGILFETKDGTGIFTPNLKAFNKLEEEGKVYIENLTDNEGAKLFIGRIPGARGITVDDIEKLARKCCFNTRNNVFNLNVTNGETAFRIPLYDWIDFTYKRYINLVTEVNKKRIEKCKFDIAVQEAIPVVGEFIIKNPSADDNEIINALGMDPEVIGTVLDKPISYLRKNKDTSARVKSLKDKLKELKNFNAIAYTEEIIKKL